MGPLHPAEVLNVRSLSCSAHNAVRQRARAFAECPSGSERLEQAGPLLWFQLASVQKGQWNPSRRERWNPLVRCCPIGLSVVCTACTVYVHGLHGLFSGRKRRATPTRRERVEQERPLLWPVSCSLLLPYRSPCHQASTPIKGGLWPP